MHNAIQNYTTIPSSKIICIFQLCKGMCVCKRVTWAGTNVPQYGMSERIYQNDCMCVILRSVKIVGDSVWNDPLGKMEWP